MSTAVETFVALDAARGVEMPYELWHPRASAAYPLVVFSHFSGGDRRSASYLCEHLASRGYVVAAIDHSEHTLPRPSAAANETEKNERMQRLIASRVPDVTLLIDVMLQTGEIGAARIEKARVGAVGHSFGGWTVLAAPSHDPRITSVVALAPAGASHPRPGIIPARLDFAWQRAVSTLIVTGDADVSVPPGGVREIYERAPEPKRLVILRGVDHIHYVDDARDRHEAVRAMTFPPELAFMQEEMRPFDELRDETETHDIVKDLTAAHFDATLKGDVTAAQFLQAFPHYG